MVQTRQGAKNNEWLSFVRTCSEQYRELKGKQSAGAAPKQPAGTSMASGEVKEPAAKKAAKRPRLSDVPEKKGVVR